MQMRTGGFACITHFSNHIAAVYLLPGSYSYFVHVGIKRHVSEAMIDFHRVAIALFPACKHHRTVARGKNIGTNGSRKVHAFVETARAVNGVDAPAKTRSCAG